MTVDINDLGRVASEQALVNEAPAGLHPSGFDPSRVKAWLQAMMRQGEDRVWRGAEKAAAYIELLEAEREAYRTQAINRGWNWNLCNAYGRDEYERHLGVEVDKTLEIMLGRKSFIDGSNEPASAIEARRAAALGAVHESAIGESRDAQGEPS